MFSLPGAHKGLPKKREIRKLGVLGVRVGPRGHFEPGKP